MKLGFISVLVLLLLHPGGLAYGNRATDPLITEYGKYGTDISVDMKVAGLSMLWSEVKYNFVYFDRVPDWDVLYLSYLPKVRKTKSILEYYRLLQEMMATLKDGHTNVRFPSKLREEEQARPAIRTQLVEGKVIVVEVIDEKLTKEGIKVGLEVKTIDGTPVQEYAEREVKPFRGASTKQNLDVRVYSSMLLTGAKDRPVKLTFADEQGSTFERNLPRDEASWSVLAAKTPSLELRMLDKNIAYLAVNNMADDGMDDKFDSIFSTIEKADALILDVRANDGGSDQHGAYILSYLTDKPFELLRSMGREYQPYERAQGGDSGWIDHGVSKGEPHGGKVFTKPVVLLMGPRTISAAEDFCVGFDAMKRGKMIGEPTAGSTGQPLTINLPGGGIAGICTLKCTYPDGKEFVGVGVQPDVLVHPTIADIRAGRDTVLEAAMSYLNKTAIQ